MLAVAVSTNCTRQMDWQTDSWVWFNAPIDDTLHVILGRYFYDPTKTVNLSRHQ